MSEELIDIPGVGVVGHTATTVIDTPQQELLRLSPRTREFILDRLLNDLALLRGWASLIVNEKDDPEEAKKAPERAEAIRRIAFHWETDVRSLFYIQTLDSEMR